MNTAHEVISAFLDDEPFDPQELAKALDDPAGRTLLVDSVLLRRIVQPADALPAMKVLVPLRRYGWRALAAAAMFVVAVASGYLLGGQRSTESLNEAPQPTQVVQAVPFTPAGGGM